MLRKVLLAVAIAGLVTGLALSPDGATAPGGKVLTPGLLWTAASLPVIAVLAVSILRDFWIGRFGVDAIALVSMSAALLLGQSLAGVVVAIMYAGGTVLEDFARGRAERDLKALTDRSPRIAHRKGPQGIETISASEVRAGDELVILAGEMLPVDGVVLEGTASVDESAVTGEPLPVALKSGDPLRSGTVNAGEAFAMRATAAADASTYAGIVRMVAAAQNVKAPFIRMADRFALFLLPVTLAVAGLAWLASGDPVRGLAVLVVATPCPLILAAPVAFIGGISRAARAGVLMKGSVALEALAQARTAIFDKTGTLTHGGASLIGAQTAPGIDPDDALRLLASVEQASHHVIAESIVAMARSRGLPLTAPTGVREYRGSGIEGFVGETAVLAGSRALVMAGAPLPDWASESQQEQGEVLEVFLALDGVLGAVFTFGDEVRKDAAAVIGKLRNAGFTRIIMLTGDGAASAGRISELLRLDGVVADATPAMKVSTVEAETGRAGTVMVGDGINDAPALATASVGIAMGARGATASSEAADVVILPDRLEPVASAVLIARRTRSIAMQSIVAGLALSGIGMGFAAAGMLTPVAGAIFQEVIDVAVILNALRALTEGGGRWTR